MEIFHFSIKHTDNSIQWHHCFYLLFCRNVFFISANILKNVLFNYYYYYYFVLKGGLKLQLFIQPTMETITPACPLGQSLSGVFVISNVPKQLDMQCVISYIMWPFVQVFLILCKDWGSLYLCMLDTCIHLLQYRLIIQIGWVCVCLCVCSAALWKQKEKALCWVALPLTSRPTSVIVSSTPATTPSIA